MGITRRRPSFAAAPYGLVDDETISAQAKAVYLVLDRYADYETGATFVGKDRVAKKCGFSKTESIDRYLHELREKGWLSWKRRWRRPTGEVGPSGRPVYKYSFSPGEGFEPTTNLYTVHDRVGIPPTEEVPTSPTGEVPVPPAEGEPYPPTAGTNENQVNENQVNENQEGAIAPVADATPPAAGAPADSKKEPHQLPRDWQPDNKLWAAMSKKYPQLNLHDELQKFRDYWHTRNDKQSFKVDWGRTWQNRLKAVANPKPSKYPPRLTKSDQASQWAEDMIKKIETEEGVNNDPLPF